MIGVLRPLGIKRGRRGDGGGHRLRRGRTWLWLGFRVPVGGVQCRQPGERQAEPGDEAADREDGLDLGRPRRRPRQPGQPAGKAQAPPAGQGARPGKAPPAGEKALAGEEALAGDSPTAGEKALAGEEALAAEEMHRAQDAPAAQEAR